MVARWTKSKSSPSFIAAIKITGVDDIGMVNKIADVIAEHKAVVRSFNYKMDDGMFEGMLNIMVSNHNVLYGVIRKIQSIKGILKASRIDSGNNFRFRIGDCGFHENSDFGLRFKLILVISDC